ncbi:MAG: CoA transferase, partial [Gammaproteobacteria bacterium]|nr:CoA transferase [Gammaproteobacteria bacterium]
VMGLNYYGYLATDRLSPRVGPNPLAQAGSAGTFATKDGTLLVNANNHRLFLRMAEAVGRPELAEDDRFATAEAADRNRRELRRIFAAHFATDTASNWDARLRGAGVPCGRLKDASEAVQNPQLAYRRTLATVSDVAGIDGGELRCLGAGFLVDDEPQVPSKPAPRLGQHTAEVLAELGYDDERIADLRAGGVFGG